MYCIQDPAGQLKVAASSTSSENRGYAYDAAWNLNELTNNGTLSTYSVNGVNELSSLGGTSYSYDTNGNLTGNGTVTFAYDDENRLASVQTNGAPALTTFVYDGLGRLREQLVWTQPDTGGGGADAVSLRSGTTALRTGITTPASSGGGGTWTLTSGIEYIYDGKRVIQERDIGNNPLVSYTRGNDLSGTLEGAGGIGGLLARTDGSGSTFYHADGNGNITYLETSAQGLGAKYRYDPFGNLTSSSGTYAPANTYRFSSKEWVPSVNGYYYLYRFYVPGIERWLNRDPIGERGGKNLYRNVGNNLISVVDLFGLIPWQDVSWWPPQTQPPNTGGPVFNDGNNWNPGSDNCLAYGLDVHGCIQPDGTPDGEGNAKDCPGLKKQLTSGKFSQNYPVPDSGTMCGKCKNGEHKIKVFSDGNGGYHIQRQDADGSWSEMSLNPTYPPRPAQPDSGKPCGEVCVPNQ